MTVSELQQAYTGWHIWRSQAGRWWAARVGLATWGQSDSHATPMTVDADTLPALAAALACT